MSFCFGKNVKNICGCEIRGSVFQQLNADHNFTFQLFSIQNSIDKRRFSSSLFRLNRLSIMHISCQFRNTRGYKHVKS